MDLVNDGTFCFLISLVAKTILIIFLQEMGLLEVKHGLLQIAESLDFLHNNARLIHRAISPEVYISYLTEMLFVFL